MTLPFSKIRNIVLILALLLLAGGVGYTLGERRVTLGVTPEKRLVVNQKSPDTEDVDFSLFWDVWQRMSRYYIDRTSLDTQKMVWGAISGMVSAAGDPYTVFLPPKENEDFKQDLGGEFSGIGAQLGLRDNRIIVIAPLKGTPAERAGIRSSDWILKVDDVETVGWTVPTAVTKIRGPAGTTVKLNILHENGTEPEDITVRRDKILVPSVTTWVKAIPDITEISSATESARIKGRSDRIAYLSLSQFGDHTNEEWLKSVDEILSLQQSAGTTKGLILDLRNNPGGYLEGAVFVASEFIKRGQVVSQVNSDGSRQEYPVSRVGKLYDIPLVVLINKGSASASEIVAGALRDHNRARIVGETSFGKGSVQTPQELTGGAGIHITTGKWFTPNGGSISKEGIHPDLVVARDIYEASADGQLAKAIELLLQ